MDKKIGILGGGISGLFSAFLLLLSGYNNITIHEKDGELGGRLQSYQFDDDKVEAGGSVIRDDNVHIRFLLDFFNIQYTKIEDTFAYILTTDGRDLTYTNEYRKKLLNKVCSKSRTNETFKEACERILDNQNDIDCLLIGTSYGEIFDSEAKNECNQNFWDEFLFVDKSYYYVNNGFSFLIKTLSEFLLKQGVTIYIHSDVKEIMKHYQWKIKSNSKMYSYDILINTIPYYYFKTIKIDKLLYDWDKLMKKQYFYVPYVRIYSRLEDKFEMDRNVCSDGHCGRIIPVNEENNLIMSVYTDKENADYWGNINDEELNGKIDEALYKCLGHFVDYIPKVIDSKKFYWKFGISSWKPSHVGMERNIKLINHPYSNLYCVGESYSLLPGWIEGSLESVYDGLKDILRL